MLQRIQTLYMLAVVGFMTALCLSPLAYYAVDGVEENFMAFDFWWLGTLFAICALVPFVAIWLYKRRFVQIRLLCAELVLLIGAQAFALWYAIGITRTAEAAGSITMSSVATPTLFPLVCIILVLLALRGVIKDEKLVRSLDRIR